MKIIFLVGLPGSGKTYLGKQLESDSNIFIDDISKCGLKLLQDALTNNYKSIIIADCFLCKRSERILALNFLQNNYYSGEIEWIFFENNPEKCFRNVDKRADGRAVKGLIKHLSGQYIIPHDSKIVEIKNEN